MRTFILFQMATILFFSCDSQEKSNVSFFEKKNTFKSQIIKKIKAPQSYNNFNNPPDTIDTVYYTSDNRKLKGLLHTSNIDSTKRNKAIVYLHGGFSLGYGDLNDCKPFIDAGYIVFTPCYRGENGNPGHFEYFMGEVSDAENSVKWLAQQNYIDTNNIYVFGHSIGGEMSLLLSMNNNCPSKLNGSSVGLYFKESLSQLVGKNNIPFDSSNDNEYLYRCPIYLLPLLERKHIMYMGTNDYYQESLNVISTLHSHVPKHFTFIEIAGDHLSSLPSSMEKFISEIEKK